MKNGSATIDIFYYQDNYFKPTALKPTDGFLNSLVLIDTYSLYFIPNDFLFIDKQRCHSRLKKKIGKCLSSMGWLPVVARPIIPPC